MKKLLNILIFFVLISSINLLASEKVVEGIGMASGKGMAAHEVALQKALRNAVEKAVGIFVSSESLVKNFQLIEDNIYSNVEGYVKEYEILEDSKGADGLTRIKVKALVKEANLESDLKGIKVILAAKGNPKTMIVIEETMDGEPTPLISHAIESYFSSKTFPLIDQSQFNAVKEADSIGNDASKAQALASRFGAELIISGKAAASLASQREAYGVSVYAYTVSLSLKAINTDTGGILASLNTTKTEHSGSPLEASQKALSSGWEEEADKFFKKIIEKWRSNVLNYSKITMIISNCSPTERMQIKKKLKTVTGIQGLDEKSFKNNVCEFVIKVEGTYIKMIDDNISEALPELLLTSKSANRIDFEISNEE